jgi:hypothetical protein
LVPLDQLADAGEAKSSLKTLVSVVGHAPLHVWVERSHVFPPVQFVSLVHSTHVDVLPLTRHFGVLPPQAVQLAPQEVSAPQSTQALPVQV